MEKALEKLPRTINSQIRYQLTIRAFENEWQISYEFGGIIFANAVAKGIAIEDAARAMGYFFQQHPEFTTIRHLYSCDE